MKKILMTVLLVAAASQAQAMAEYDLPWVDHTISRSSDCGKGGAYALEGEISSGTSVTISVTFDVVYADGRRVSQKGHPFFIFGPNRETIESNESVFLKPTKGVYTVNKSGVFRILAAEAQTLDLPKGVKDFNNYKIEVCPVR